jgi:hypothetical protein
MPGAGEMMTPRDVIERIRTEDYLLDIDGESDRVKRGATSLHKKLNNALKLLSDDLYSKKSHFVLELVQNADDNNYLNGVVPQLTFKLKPKQLVLVNNEVGFNERNVKALCSVGESSKANKAGYIGEKGIGFKSVFTVSSAPEIHSNGFHFRFDRTDQGNLLGYVVPHWCEPSKEVQPSATTIILPAADGFEFSQKTLDGLDARLLLFLAKVRKIALHGDDETVTYHRLDNETSSCLFTRKERVGSKPQSEESHFVRIPVDFKMEGVPDEKRPGTLTSQVVLAFPVDAKGAASIDPSSQVFAFLPIRQMGFKFSIQADFLLSSSREDILTDRPWNKLLRDAIAVAFKIAVDTFKKTDELAFSFLKFIPSVGEISDPFFRPVAEAIINQLSQLECLPSAGGHWKRPSDLRIADQKFKEIFPPIVAIELFGFDYVDQRVHGGNELLRRLGAKDIVPGDLLTVFRLHGDWLKQQPLDWRARFYAMLAESDVEKLSAGLVSLPCIPTNTGDLAVPAQTSVFYPLSRGMKYGFEQELVIIDSELLDLAQQYSGQIPELFAKLKVKFDIPYDLVTSHILPKHHGESWKTSEEKALLGHLRYVKDKIDEYLSGAAASGKTEAQAFQTLHDGMWLGTKHKEGGTWFFGRANTLYLGKEYRPHFCIETLLGEALADIRLVSNDYLTTKSKDHEAEAESWRQFFRRLGLCLTPSLIPLTNGDFQCGEELGLLLGSSHSQVRKATLECIDQNWDKYAIRLSYNQLVGRTSIAKETKFAMALRAMQAPTKKKTSVPLSEAFYPTQEMVDLFGDKVSYVDASLSNDSMLDACRITYRPDAKACVKRLKQLKAEGGDTAKQLQAIYRNLERLWDTDSARIKLAFVSDGLIRIKGTHATWAAPGQVSWRSNGTFLDILYPPLQSQYKDFSGFFLDKMGIPKELSTAKWVEALEKLDTVESVDERRREALAIYKRANRDLNPRFGREAAPMPEWLDTFEVNEVFLNHRDELVPNDENLFANDAPELASLFVDDDDISILCVSPEEVPRIEKLLDATNVRRISTSVNVAVVEAKGGRLDTELTARVRRAAPYLGRVLYARSHNSFEAAVEQGLFIRLRELEVIEVPELMLSVSLGQASHTTTADIAQHEGMILIRAGARSIKDQLAAELCKFLGAPEELADTFARVLLADDADSAEDFLRVRRFGPLPPDLQQAIDDVAGPLFADVEQDSLAGIKEEETPSGQLSESDEIASTGIVQHAAPNPEQAASTGTPATPPSIASPQAPSAVKRPTSEPSSISLPSTKDAIPPSPKDDAPPLKGVAVGGAAAPSSLGKSAGKVDDGEPPEQNVTDKPTYTRKWDFKGGTSGAARPKPGRDSKHRTRSGRLMSYAASPGDSDRANSEDDQAKAAAREATGKAAVEYFIATESARWQSLTLMPHNNPGFDVLALAHDGSEEFIEVKGQSDAWTEDGVALTPTEMMKAQLAGERYWLCIVEHVYDEKRRSLYLVQNPYGLTQQFRFDSGWKSAAISKAAVPMKPEAGLIIDIPDVGLGRIQSVRKKGRFFSLHVILDGGKQVHKLFNPATMKLSTE